MEIVDKTKEQWQLGDIIKSKNGTIGIMIKDDDDRYIIMDITGVDAYRIRNFYGDKDLVELQQNKLTVDFTSV